LFASLQALGLGNYTDLNQSGLVIVSPRSGLLGFAVDIRRSWKARIFWRRFMSKIMLYTFLVTVALIVLAVAFDLPIVAGTAGLLMLIGLIYAYVVSRRETEGR